MGNYNQLHLYLIKFTLLTEEYSMGKFIRPLVCLLAIVTSLILPLPVTGAVELPDLEPTQIAVSNLYAGVANTVTVIVANNNNATATNFDVKLEVGNVTIGNSTVSNILPKNDSWYYPAYVNFNWIPTAAGNYTLQATVDSIGNVTESNETNNHLEQNVTVSALSPITVKVRVEGKTANIWSGNLTFQNSTITDKKRW
jgi:subtilase family serine protease